MTTKTLWQSIGIIFLILLIIYIAYSYTPNIEPMAEIVQVSEIVTQVEQDKPQVEILSNKEYLGEFVITAYCPCKKCCGRQTGITKSGVKAIEGVTIGTDWGVIPNGAVVEIEGLGERVAQDTGGAIKGNRIDLYMQSHFDCVKFGIKKLKVWRD